MSVSFGMAKPKRPRDMNQLAVHVGRLATHEIKELPPPRKAKKKKISAKKR